MANKNVEYPAISSPCATQWTPIMPPGAPKPDSYCIPLSSYSLDEKRILSGLANAIDPMQRASMGLCKPSQIIGTTQVNANFYSVNFLADSVIDTTANTAVVPANLTGDLILLTGVTIPAGTTLFLQFTKIKLVSGLAIGYGDPFR